MNYCVCICRSKDEWKIIRIKNMVTFINVSFSNSRKNFFNAKLKGPVPKKEEIVFPFVSTHYTRKDPLTSLTTKFLNVVIKMNMFPKNLILKFMLVWHLTIKKVNCYAANLIYITWDLLLETVNCFTVIIAVVIDYYRRLIQSPAWS